jgi:hypothetical protein
MWNSFIGSRDRSLFKSDRKEGRAKIRNLRMKCSNCGSAREEMRKDRRRTKRTYQTNKTATHHQFGLTT